MPKSFGHGWYFLQCAGPSAPTTGLAVLGRQWRAILALLLLPPLVPAASEAGHYFVAPYGSDASPGSLESPWQTITAGLGRLTAGDTLDIRAGHYYESPIAAVSGTAEAPIVIRSFPGEQVIVDSGIPEFQVAGNAGWELVDPAIGEYRSVQSYPGGTIYGYVGGVAGYENERVALVPYTASEHFRATTDQFGSAFYVGPGTFADTLTERIHIRLSKTSDMLAAEARYGTVFPSDHANPADYPVILSRASYTLKVTGSYLVFQELTFHQARNTINLGPGSHHLRFEGITAWLGDSTFETTGMNVHQVTITRCRLYGDSPYWIFWSDMKDPPAPAGELRATAVDMRLGANSWEISYNHIRGSGQDLIGTNDYEFNIVVHHNRLENAGDDALELEGTSYVGRVEVYENFILNPLVAVSPGQSTPMYPGPLLVFRNVICLLRNPPVNRQEGINEWNGGARFGFEYMFKQNGINYSTANAHYYHNTLVMLSTDSRGLNLTPRFPAHTRVANNLCVMVNGVVNGIFLRDSGQVVNGNLYWKMNTVDTAPLLADYDDVPAFHAATGLEAQGIGAAPRRGTDPEFVGFAPQFVDPTQAFWELIPASEKPSLTDFCLSATSPARDAGIPIPAHPTLGPLPDTRSGLDIGAITYGSPASDFQAFPFVTGTATAPPLNDAPSVDAGAPQSIALPSNAVLDGTVVDDLLPIPSALTVVWQLVSGPAPIAIADSTAIDTEVQFTQPGLYLLQLTASDGEGVSSDLTTVSVVAPVVIERRVTASSDDAEESTSGSVTLTSSDLEMMRSQQAVGIRFTQLGIPGGAQVTHAYVQFQVDEAQSEPTLLTIAGQALANPSGFTTANGDIGTRTRTSSSVAWAPLPWDTIGAAGMNQRTPDLAPVIQEIIDGAGGQPVDSLVLIVAGSGQRTAESYDGTPAAAPLLHLEWGGGSSSPVGRSMDEVVFAKPRVIPHPLSGRGMLNFTTRRAGPVRIELLDLQGRVVRTVLRASLLAAGSHWIPLDGLDESGARLRSGVFFYRLATTEGMITGRVLIVR